MMVRLPRYRIALGWAAALAILYVASPTARSLATGIPLAVLGLVTRGAAAGTIRKGTELARSGPYAFTRNPLYLGSSLLAAGFGIMSGSPAAAFLLLALSAPVYAITIRNEERELRQRYGREFEDFRSQVPCFLPRRISRRAFHSFRFSQFIANGEYNATLGFLAATGTLAAKYWLGDTLGG